MTDDMILPINKAYFLFFVALTTILFLLDTLFLIFGGPSLKDIIPLLSMDILYFIVIVFYTKKALVPHNAIALELNNDELIDHIVNIRVKWNNVSNIRFAQRGYNSYICIYVNDKKEVIRQTKNLFKRFALYANILFTGTPVRITLLYVKGKNSDIFNTIHGYFLKMQCRTDID